MRLIFFKFEMNNCVQGILMIVTGTSCFVYRNLESTNPVGAYTKNRELDCIRKVVFCFFS